MYLKERLSAKIHNGVVNEANLDYEGSITIGKSLLKASGINPYDKVQVLNITNGNRIETYVIEGSILREIELNGAAANLFAKGDRVIIIAYLYEMIGELTQGGIYNGRIKTVENEKYQTPDVPPIKIVILDGTEHNNIKTEKNV